jgi:ATP-dependent Lhr-like helicase
MSPDDPPSSFHPLIRGWFTRTYGKPTAVQAAAWPLIEAGEHVLALAPTGSGKTLTAFLACISRFAEGAFPGDKLSVLYVSPLKALNEDIRRNLLEPLGALGAEFEKAGLSFPAIRVETRSGDTPQAERRRFLIHPPSILALTPESLAILLLNPRGRQALSTVRYLILDEIHAVLGNKRGSFLSCQIDRLSSIAGEFQRVSLSATVRPPEAAAEFAGGLNRMVRVVSPPGEKKLELLIDFPGPRPGDPGPGSPAAAPDSAAAGGSAAEVDPGSGNIPGFAAYGKRYELLTERILERIGVNRTTLVFTDSRRRAERLCFLLNRRAEKIVAYTHHGSLSKELRRAVEQRLADGALPCVVATASLELGIDIGGVDEVILAGSPGAVSQALQRIGRSGHGVGRVSRGRLFPFHGMDLLLAAALWAAVDERDIEETRPIKNPLDVLAQIILALCVEKKRNIDELYEFLRGFYVFRDLSRFSYDACIRMLAGCGTAAGGSVGGKGPAEPWKRIRELKPRLAVDRQTGELEALPGVLRLLYSSGGVITNRGPYSLRLSNGTKIGELDEEFVWERRTGDCFDFGGRGWRILSIGPEAVEAAPLEKPVNYVPFWKADAVFRSAVLSRRIIAILDRYGAGETPGPDSPGASALPGNPGFQARPWEAALNEFLDSQRRAQGPVPLAGSGHITAEIIDSGESAGDFYSAVIHTFRGGAVNYPLALALAQDMEEKLKLRVEACSDDNALLFLIPRFAGTSPEALIRESLFTLDEDDGGLCRGERLFRKRLESSGIFGARFREAAERSLLLPRAGFGKRTPLWITRQRSKRLFDAAAGEGEFPVTAEAWRSCLRDDFDMEGFREFAGGLRDGTRALSFFRTAGPSPFSRDLVRQEINALMYEYDEREDLRGGRVSLSDEVIAEALGEAGRRPKISRALVDDFCSRLRREIPGWAPEDETALAEWVKERIALPPDEWETLVNALPEELREKLKADPGLGNRLVLLRKPAALPVVVHREWKKIWGEDPRELLGPWLRYEGPLPLSRIAAVFGLTGAEAADAAEALIEAEEAVGGVALDGISPDNGENGFPGQAADGGHNLICDRENFGFLLRLARKKNRPAVRERPGALLVPFLALRQGLAGAGFTGERAPWQALTCFTAPVKLWETEFFPARRPGYTPETLDREIRGGALVWYGWGKERVGLCRPEDLELVLPEDRGEIFPGLEPGFFDRPRDFWEIKEALAKNSPGQNNAACTEALWGEVWRGRLSADTWEPVRQGLAAGFAYRETAYPGGPGSPAAPSSPGGNPAYPYGQTRRRIPRALRDLWRTGAPVRGNWFSLVPDYQGPADSMDEEELNRDRVRLLLERWGILCRPLLEREARFHPGSALSWSRLLPAMRRMELAGELGAGRFFSGINSLQFASPRIIAELEAAENFRGLYWMNAADPASPAGLAVEGLDRCVPARTAASRLCFRGPDLIAVSCRNGKDLDIFIPPDDPDLGTALGFLSVPRTRSVFPEKKAVVEKINGRPAAGSGYAAALKSAGFISDRGKLYLW